LPGSKLQKLAAVALVVSSVGFFVLRAATSHDIPFVVQDADAPWIMPPDPVAADLHQWGSERAPAVRFARQFRYAGGDGGAVRAHVRALRGFSTWLNGEAILARHLPGDRRGCEEQRDPPQPHALPEREFKHASGL